MTSSNGNIFRVTGPLCGEVTGHGEFPAQRPVTLSFDVFFDLRLNKRLNTQYWGWWFETHRAHYDVIVMCEPKRLSMGTPLILHQYGKCRYRETMALRSSTLQWRHNGGDGVSNHRRLDCLLSSLFRRRSKNISKLRVTGLCAGNSPVTSEFPAPRASNAEYVSIWWRHHVIL